MRKLVRFFILLALLSSCQKSTQKKTIGIVPFGEFNEDYVDSIELNLESLYGIEVKRLPSRKLPQHAFIHVKSPRYRADILLKYLIELKPDSVDYILGLTHKDISMTKRTHNGKVKLPEWKYGDWGIMGLGYLPGVSCVVSDDRLRGVSDKVFYSRLKKITAHEVGHNFGLYHCDNDDKCLMRDAAETVKTIDKVELKLCKKCRKEIGLD